MYSQVAQLVEHWTCNPEVLGSSPSLDLALLFNFTYSLLTAEGCSKDRVYSDTSVGTLYVPLHSQGAGFKMRDYYFEMSVFDNSKV